MKPTRIAGMPYPFDMPLTETTWSIGVSAVCSDAIGICVAAGSV